MTSKRLPPGTVVGGKYRVEEHLGGGGMGEVYRAEHQLAGRTVALKLLRADLAEDQSLTRRFFQEAQAANRIHHPNIVDVLDAGFSDHGPYVVMECLQGLSLSAALARVKRLSQTTAVAIVLPMLDALDAAHEAGIVHRDLKPENVFLARAHDKHEVRVKILDFGIAKVLDAPDTSRSPETRTGVVFGTPDYLSPEQALGEGVIDGRSDVFAVGIVLFELLTGKRPFESTNAIATAYRIVHSAPPKIAASGVDVDPALQGALDVALAKAKEVRFATAAAFAEALAPLAENAATRREALYELLEQAIAVGPPPAPPTPPPDVARAAAANAVTVAEPGVSPLGPTERPPATGDYPQLAASGPSALAESVEPPPGAEQAVVAKVPAAPSFEGPGARQAPVVPPTLVSSAPVAYGRRAAPHVEPVREVPSPPAAPPGLRAPLTTPATRSQAPRAGTVTAPPRPYVDTPFSSGSPVPPSSGSRGQTPASGGGAASSNTSSGRAWSPRPLPKHVVGRCHVRGSLIRAVGRWIERAHGAAGKAQTFALVPADVAETFRADGYNALVWYDLAVLDTYMQAATIAVLRGELLPWRALARENFERDLGPIFRPSQRGGEAPTILARGAASWSKVLDFGTMRLGDPHGNRLQIKVEGFDGASLALRHLVTGTFDGLLRTAGFGGVNVRILSGETSFARDFELELGWFPR